MILSIITINRNNAFGLEKTMRSVLSQTFEDYEYVVVDGASTDKSTDVIQQFVPLFGEKLLWVSEPDGGIYNAMNKAIRMANGEYVMILNSSDWLADESIVGKLDDRLTRMGMPDIMYGNMLKIWPNGRVLRDSIGGEPLTMSKFYHGTLNHGGTCIKRVLFDRYGMYDESMQICSDWAWFMKVVVFGGIVPVYTELDTIYFDMTGISESGPDSHELIHQERRRILEAMLPQPILADYDCWDKDMRMMKKIRQHSWAYQLVKGLYGILIKTMK